MINFLLNNKTNFQVYFLTLLVFSSIGIEPHYLLNLSSNFVKLNNFELTTLVNLIRGWSPYLTIVIIISLLSIEKNQNKSFNKPLLIFFIYIIFQIISFFLLSEEQLLQKWFVKFNWFDNFRITYLAVQSLAFLTLLFYVNSKNNSVLNNYVKFVIILIIIIYTYFLAKNYNYFFYETPNLNMYATNYNLNYNILTQAVPRSSGVARMLLLFNLAIIFYHFNKKLKNNFEYLLIFFIISFLTSSMYLFNSRFVLLNFYLFTTVIFIISSNKKNILKNIRDVFLISIFSIFILNLTMSLKNKFFLQHQINLSLNESKNKMYFSQLDYKKSYSIYHKAILLEEPLTQLKFDNYSILFEDQKFNFFKKMKIFSSFFNLKYLEDSRLFTIRDTPKKEIQKEIQNLLISREIDEYKTGQNNQLIINDNREKRCVFTVAFNKKLITDNNVECAFYDLEKKILSIYKGHKLIATKDLSPKYVPDNIQSASETFDNDYQKNAGSVSNIDLSNYKIGDKIDLTDGIHTNPKISIKIQVKNEIIIQKQNVQINSFDCKYVNSKANQLLTGRICHWYILLKEVIFNFFGKGPQFDRTIVKWGASNSMIYAYVSAGIVGVIFYLYFSIKVLNLFILEFHNKNIKLSERIILLILIVIMCRTLVEVSISYWGVDQLLFFSLFLYLYKTKLNKKIK